LREQHSAIRGREHDGRLTLHTPLMKIYIKYMVSLRCKMLVISELEKLGLMHGEVELGEVEIRDNLSDSNRHALKRALLRAGLELMDDKRAILVERIKLVVIEMVHYADEQPKVNFSDHLSEKLHLDYTYMANLFAEVKGVTIEQFIIAHRIERVKELMLYDELNLTEIAYKLHFSSVAHLSNQFKKVTGLSPSFFKKLRRKRIQTLEQIGELAD
jgi:AraC-like DNA-binding protein